MQPLVVPHKQNFIGRVAELKKIATVRQQAEAQILVVYGRRRVGKTELLEQAFRDRNLLKFEGIEGLSPAEQFAHVLKQLAVYTENTMISQLVITTWVEFFKILAPYVKTGPWTVYLEELQWLACYEGKMIAELKYAWDNFLRHNPELVVILCGSAPAFMLEQVVHSKALYNRSQTEMHLKEFNIVESKAFLGKRSNKEVFDAYLSVGGILEYLKWMNKESSVFLSLCTHAFSSGSFFSREYEKIFTSNLSKNKHYKAIIAALGQEKFLSRDALVKKLKLQSGGSLTTILLDLEASGFITKYSPYNLKDSTLVSRYTIEDAYLNFYFKFIAPIQKNIDNGDYDANPRAALNTASYQLWLGLAFERWCRRYHTVIAKILGFSGVQYQSGVFFSRATDKLQKGFQIDLLFERADHVITVCEIKYLQTKVGTSVIAEMDQKLALLPNKKNKTIQKVLICSEGAEPAVEAAGYFDVIITGEQLLAPQYW